MGFSSTIFLLTALSLSDKHSTLRCPFYLIAFVPSLPYCGTAATAANGRRVLWSEQRARARKVSSLRGAPSDVYKYEHQKMTSTNALTKLDASLSFLVFLTRPLIYRGRIALFFLTQCHDEPSSRENSTLEGSRHFHDVTDECPLPSCPPTLPWPSKIAACLERDGWLPRRATSTTITKAEPQLHILQVESIRRALNCQVDLGGGLALAATRPFRWSGLGTGLGPVHE